ncbi:restriction endonuclease [Streptomyces sp. NPDC091268]|uniref:restriction endonuclease n=1 Tax=Streptomyces sp. NPDC091268 TaxID=3365979 RepID=UPI0037F9F396
MMPPGEDRPGSPPALRDVVLAVGLVGICAGGLAVFLKAAGAAGAVGAGGSVVPIVTVVLIALGAALARWGVAPVRRPARIRRPRLPSAPDAYAGAAPPLPEVAGEALDHAGVDADGFEHTVAALCVRDGCTAVEVVGGAGDLGADVVATTADGRRLVVQCKHYADGNRVGSQDLQRFGGTCFAVHEADVAVVVTTSSYTAPAAEYAAACGIVCVDGEALAAWTDQTAPPPWQAPLPGSGLDPAATADATAAVSITE